MTVTDALPVDQTSKPVEDSEELSLIQIQLSSLTLKRPIQ